MKWPWVTLWVLGPLIFFGAMTLFFALYRGRCRQCHQRGLKLAHCYLGDDRQGGGVVLFYQCRRCGMWSRKSRGEWSEPTEEEWRRYVMKIEAGKDREVTVMNVRLTAGELRLIERLRKTERSWRRWRWVLMGVALFALVGYGYVFIRVFMVLRDAGMEEDALMFFIFYCKVLVVSGTFGILLGLMAASWGGSPPARLLLKVLDEQGELAAADGNATR